MISWMPSKNCKLKTAADNYNGKIPGFMYIIVEKPFLRNPGL